MRLKSITLLVALGAICTQANAFTVFFGNDSVTGPGDARPNSDAAAAGFDTVASSFNPISSITFEQYADGTTTPLVPKPGVTITGSPLVGDSGAYVSSAQTPDLGYNTTPGGSKELRIWRGFDNNTYGANFHFDMPIMSFGFYVTGLQSNFSGDAIIEFADQNGTYIANLPKPAPGGDGRAATQFFGFVDDLGRSISDVQILSVGAPNGPGGRDLWAIDDFRYTACPEPASMAAILIGAAGLLARKRRSRA